METVLPAMFTLLVSSGGWYFFYRHYLTRRESESRALEDNVRALEKTVHIKERDFLDEKNKIELSHLGKLKQERLAAFDEGRELGVSEREKDHQIAMTNLKSEHGALILRERELAATEAQERTRREFELQAKMFSVSIRPYVKVTKDSGFFTDEFLTQTGYQYQLLVNGIPAFQPHVVVESTEKTSNFKDENLKFLIQHATKAAEIAVQLYMGGNGQYVKFAPEVVERETK
jgi:hypothetical protein